jgi:2-oxo-4-hydroxy-4-carboxy-5-ureidoimidazoline decarboxylase
VVLPDALGLERLNAAPAEDARAVFLACCSSPRWADLMVAGRPYADEAAALSAADRALAELSEDDLADALQGHARIGEKAQGEAGAWSRGEQAGMSSAGTDLQDAMAKGNAAYEERFGRVYLVAAAGLPADQLLARLEARLGNDDETERGVVRAELGKINRLRLQRVLAPRADAVHARPATNLTTHVLDAATGRPAIGVSVRLEDRQGTELGKGATDDDGRIKDLVSEPIGPGSYRLIFDTAAYHESVGTTGFYPEVIISFTVTDQRQHHHVPLLLAPFAYSTYRGS